MARNAATRAAASTSSSPPSATGGRAGFDELERTMGTGRNPFSGWTFGSQGYVVLPKPPADQSGLQDRFDVLDMDGEKVGDFSYHYTRDASNRKVVYFDALYLLPRAQGTGAGRAILEALTTHARQSGAERLTVEAVGVGAYAWARAGGFQWRAPTNIAWNWVDLPSRAARATTPQRSRAIAALGRRLDRVGNAMLDLDNEGFTRTSPEWRALSAQVPSPARMALMGGPELMVDQQWIGYRDLTR